MSFNTPGSAAKNGPPSDLEAVNHVSQLNQLLGTGSIQFQYPGNQILTPNGSTFAWSGSGSVSDFSQPFVLSGTIVNRVTIPVLANGNGADLMVTLCPDSSGSPNLSSPIAQTVVPASQITNLATTGVLASSQFSSVGYTGITTQSWLLPAGSASANATVPSTVTSDFYTVLTGGDANSVDQAVNTVAICSFDGATFSLPKAGPNLPNPLVLHGAMITNDSIVVAGGASAISTGSVYSASYAASWNPDTGVVGAWSTQASLPQTTCTPATASSGSHVYVIGGTNNNISTFCRNTVYYATVDNGTINSWKSTSSMPAARSSSFAAVCNGWLVVAGGLDASAVVKGDVYYAKVNSNGTLGSWYTGPSLPTAVYAGNSQLAVFGNNVAVVGGIDGTSNFSTSIQILPITATHGPADKWRLVNDPNVANLYFYSGFTLDDAGDADLVATDIVNNAVYVYSLIPTSLVSVPLPATGLTNGATYHVVVHQKTTHAPLVDYLQFGTTVGALPSKFLSRAVGSGGAWTADTASSINLTVYNNSIGVDGPYHTWQDPQTNANVNGVNRATTSSTFVYDWVGRTLGYCEAVQEPQDPLNLNTLTTNSVTSWTPTNATLTATSAQTHGGYAFSGLLTPNGVSALAYASSELISVQSGVPYTASSWFYMTTAYTNLSMSVNWFDSAQTYLATSSNTQSIGAATWTYFTNTFTPPVGAAYAALVPTLGGTPSAGNPLYISYITLIKTDPDLLASVAQVKYDSGRTWGPLGVSQLND